MPRGRPGGRQMPDARAVIKFQMPHPRDWNVSKCPANARRGWAPLELTDALSLQRIYVRQVNVLAMIQDTFISGFCSRFHIFAISYGLVL